MAQGRLCSGIYINESISNRFSNRPPPPEIETEDVLRGRVGVFDTTVLGKYIVLAVRRPVARENNNQQ